LIPILKEKEKSSKITKWIAEWADFFFGKSATKNNWKYILEADLPNEAIDMDYGKLRTDNEEELYDPLHDVNDADRGDWVYLEPRYSRHYENHGKLSIVGFNIVFRKTSDVKYIMNSAFAKNMMKWLDELGFTGYIRYYLNDDIRPTLNFKIKK
jgi:hypothetical protein